MHIFVVFATTVQEALSRSLAAVHGSSLHPAWASLGVVQQTAAKGGAWLPRSTHPATHPQIGRTAPQTSCILALALLHCQEHVPREHDGDMRCHRVIRKRAAILL